MVAELQPAERREVVDAVMAERYRCAKVLERAIRDLGGRNQPGSPKLRTVYLLADLAERIRWPWKVRNADRPRQSRAHYCCTRCGGDGHNRARCPDKAATSGGIP